MKMHFNARLKSNLIPYICISKETHKKFLSNSDLSIDIDIDISYEATAENVLGFIKGKTDELVVISAHYDHLGYDNGEVCNGADDDGSGTVSLMSIAKAFQKAYNDGYKPKRSVLFLAVSGEEKGLFGSKYYTDNPIFPLENTIANLNIDMVGRVDTVHDNINYIYLIGSDRISKDLHYLSEQVNKDHIGFDLDYTFNSESDPNHFYYRSDHYNFAKNGIPVIFYFSGIHKDYHKPTDDVEKINFEKLEKTAQYVFLTAWELVNREKRIK
jgi:Zn-dependent M28 family amino/carboxypeptidase